MEYLHKTIQKNTITEPLILEIEKYVKSILEGNIPRISYSTYRDFYKSGSRKEFEKIYFERRKQLTALGLYLQWSSSKKAMDYFQELLWEICNEFSWCLAAHLSYGEDKFEDEPSKIIDLFSAETAQTLCEILIIHEDKIDKLLGSHIKKQIEQRVIAPFINRNWGWETATHNWSAVCSGCIGIIALLMEKGEKRNLILDRVERSLECYLNGFGNDGATLEGIGYWSYGFGYYIYYKALKNEIYVQDSEKDINKIRAIANFPQCIQISEKVFLPFSDVPPSMILPSGLISYLHNKYDSKVPLIEKISSFDFDHCYRWAHVSRNLWWTTENILNKKLSDISFYFEDAMWMVYRKDNMFFAIKGGNNNEPHNHNDIGSFVIAVDGELILTDLGAGAYTKGYFGSERYTYNHTRSYWHSVPFINECEQEETQEKSIVINNNITNDCIEFEIDLTPAYPSANINKFCRKTKFDNSKDMLLIEDYILGEHITSVNEGFISYIEPECIREGKIIWKGNRGNLILSYDNKKFNYFLEKGEINNHYNELINIYRLALVRCNKNKEATSIFKFYYEAI